MMPLSAITTETIEQKALLLHEPRWARLLRRTAWQEFEKSPEINWKKTKTPVIDLERSYQFTPEKDDAVQITSLPAALSHQGVIFCDMKSALLERADLLEKYLSKDFVATRDRLTLCHASLWENGYFLYAPAGVAINEPLKVQLGGTEKNTFFRNLILLEEGARAEVEETMSSGRPGPSLSGSATQIFTEAKSEAIFRSLQDWSSQADVLQYYDFHALQESRILATMALLGGRSGRVMISGHVPETGALIEQHGIFVADNKERWKIVATMNHEAPLSKSQMRYKGILKGEAYAFLDGRITMNEAAKKSSSRLEEHTLLLSPTSRCDALPGLEIKAEEVNVSHSASVMQADQERIFYLMSRGLSEKEAKNLIISGFFEDILAKSGSVSWAESTKELIEKKLMLVT